MRLDKLTIKAQEALEAAGGIASEADAAAVEPEHLLKALLDQADGIVRPILSKVGADPAALDAAVDEALASAPSVSGAVQVGVGPRLNTVLSAAFKSAEKMKDAYVSSEHLLMALTADKGEAGRILDRAGASEARVSSAVEELRRGQQGHRPEPRGPVPGARALRAQPHRGRAGRQARSRSSGASTRSAERSRCCRVAPRTTRC